MTLFDNLNIDFEKHTFTYSDAAKEKNDINVVLYASYDGKSVENINGKSAENINGKSAENINGKSAKNSNNELSSLKILNVLKLKKDGEPTKLDKKDITNSLFNEGTLSCGKYKSKNVEDRLPSLLHSMILEGSIFVAFLFKKDDALKGYVVYEMVNNMVVVKLLCVSVIRKRLHDIEDETLLAILKEGSFKEFVEKRLPNKDSGDITAQNLNINTTADNFKTTHNFNALLRLAKLVRTSDNDTHFLDFDANIPAYQIRSLLTTDSSPIRSVTNKNNLRNKSVSASDNKDKSNNNTSAESKALPSLTIDKVNKSDDEMKVTVSGVVVLTPEQVQNCDVVKCVLLTNGEENDVTSKELKLDELKNESSNNNNRSYKFSVEFDVDSCYTKYELKVELKCSGESANKDESKSKVVNISSKVLEALNCVKSSSKNLNKSNSEKEKKSNSKSPSPSEKSKSKSQPKFASTKNVAVGPSDMAIVNNRVEIGSSLQMYDEDVKLENIVKEGDTFIYIKNVYNLGGNAV